MKIEEIYENWKSLFPLSEASPEETPSLMSDLMDWYNAAEQKEN